MGGGDSDLKNARDTLKIFQRHSQVGRKKRRNLGKVGWLVGVLGWKKSDTEAPCYEGGKGEESSRRSLRILKRKRGIAARSLGEIDGYGSRPKAWTSYICGRSAPAPFKKIFGKSLSEGGWFSGTGVAGANVTWSREKERFTEIIAKQNEEDTGSNLTWRKVRRGRWAQGGCRVRSTRMCDNREKERGNGFTMAWNLCVGRTFPQNLSSSGARVCS